MQMLVVFYLSGKQSALLQPSNASLRIALMVCAGTVQTMSVTQLTNTFTDFVLGMYFTFFFSPLQLLASVLLD